MSIPQQPQTSTEAISEATDQQLDDLARSFAQLLGQQEAKHARAGQACPRCVSRHNPRPGRLHSNVDNDLACSICGHVVYSVAPQPHSKFNAHC